MTFKKAGHRQYIALEFLLKYVSLTKPLFILPKYCSTEIFIFISTLLLLILINILLYY